MIYLLYGENFYAKQVELAKHIKDLSPNSLEKIDGDKLEPDDLAQIFTGISLFSQSRTIIIKQLSHNAAVWEKLAMYWSASSDNTIILLEDSVDKRTKTYKLLQKNHTVIECKEPSGGELISWLQRSGSQKNPSFTRGHAQLLVDRIGRHQMKLYYALQKVLLLDKIDESTIENVIDDEPEARVFGLIEAIIQRDTQRGLHHMKAVKENEDPHMFFGLLVSQTFLLITLSASQASAAEVAKDLNVHPYPLQKMTTAAKQLTTHSADEIIRILTQTDMQLKQSSGDAWMIIEQCIHKLLKK